MYRLKLPGLGRFTAWFATIVVRIAFQLLLLLARYAILVVVEKGEGLAMTDMN